jgi:hypothetical protein
MTSKTNVFIWLSQFSLNLNLNFEDVTFSPEKYGRMKKGKLGVLEAQDGMQGSENASLYPWGIIVFC